MSLSLYRKYRPQNFKELIGQDHIRDTLSSAVKSGRTAHAYLFCGTRGTGKTTTARILAKAINCENRKEYEACNKCAICKDFLEGKSLDLIEIDAASNRGIDEIREIVEKIKFAPTRTKYKVFVIDEAHMLTREAFNALLKTLEEPPAHAIFILATTEPHKLPPTILSRVQRYDFKRVSPKDIVRRLVLIAKKEKIKIDPEALAVIAETAEGSFRDAESVLDQVASFMGKRIRLTDVEMVLGVSDQKSIQSLLDYLIVKDTKGAINMINKILYEGHDLAFFTKNTVEYLRKLLLVKTASADPRELFSDPDKPTKQVEKLRAAEILKYMKAFIESQREIKISALPQLPLEMAIVDLTMGGQEKMIIKETKDIKEESTMMGPIKNVATQVKKKAIKLGEKAADPGNVNQFIDIWPKVLLSAGKINHSLLTLLRSSVPVDIKDKRIKLAVHFKFHKDQLLSEKRYKAIQQIIKDITGKEYRIECVVADEVDEKIIEKVKSKMSKIDRKTEENLMKSVSEVFGI